MNSLVAKLAGAILEVEDFHVLLDDATGEIARAAEADFVAIHLEQGGSRYEFRYDRSGRVAATFAAHTQPQVAQAAGRRSQILTAGMPGATQFAASGLRCAVLTPISCGKDELLTLFVAYGEPGRVLQAADVEALEALATVLALGASRHGFQQLAVYDPWTRLYNRRYLEAALPGEVERARRYRQPFALLAMDVDHFKEVNDLHGHPAGDRVLAEIAKVLLQSTRSCDAAVRTGGDEFLVLLPATSLTGVRRIADRILERIRALSFGDAREPFKVTVSGGVAMADMHSTVQSLTQEADRALYTAKRAGRDAIRLPEKTPIFDDGAVIEVRNRRRHLGI